ncbi:MAG: DUF4350 domain-containing protein [Acidimicrobiales bacterium]|nr:DUF4350 domain-containing protein [Acidimicrobiales bacterium]
MTAPTRRRGALLWLGLAGALVVAALVIGAPPAEGPPLDPRSTSADGTKALVDLLRELGGRVEITSRVPAQGAGRGVALVLVDDLSDQQRAGLDAWVRAGGVLVVADPGSTLHPAVAAGATGTVVGAPTLGRGVCTMAALVGVDRIDPGFATLYRVPAGAQRCIGPEEQAFVVSVAAGAGTVVALGGPGPFTNARLGQADNAVLAADLLVPRAGTQVLVVERAVAGEGADTLADLVPGRARDALVQLGVAFLVVVAWRARRLGRPVLEPRAVVLPGSELVAASGRLRQRAGHPDAAAGVLRAELRRELAERLGLPRDAPAEMIAEVAAARSGATLDELLAVVADRPVGGEAGLVELGRRAAEVRAEVLAR